jgi:hypothetical protein
MSPANFVSNFVTITTEYLQIDTETPLIYVVNMCSSVYYMYLCQGLSGLEYSKEGGYREVTAPFQSPFRQIQLYYLKLDHGQDILR